MRDAVKTLIEKAQGRWAGRTWTSDATERRAHVERLAKAAAEIAAAEAEGESIPYHLWRPDRDLAPGVDPEAYRLPDGCLDEAVYADEAEAERVAKDASYAEDEARVALEYLAEGDFGEAADALEKAARIERNWGDDPTWGPPAKAARELADLAEAADDAAGDFADEFGADAATNEWARAVGDDWIRERWTDDGQPRITGVTGDDLAFYGELVRAGVTQRAERAKLDRRT